MKNKWAKPAVAVLAAALIGGGLTPVLANSGNLGKVSGTEPTSVKVPAAELDKNVRYQLEYLIKEDPALLNALLRDHLNDLYIVVESENLDVKLADFIQENGAEWEKLTRESLSDVYLEVRTGDEAGFIQVDRQTKGSTTYIRGNVTNDITKVVITTPNNGKIEISSFVNHTFTVSIPAVNSTTPQYASLQAYVNDKLVDTKKLQINTGTVAEDDVIVRTAAVYEQSKKRVKVNGVVLSDVDKVVVRYGSGQKDAKLNKLWNGVRVFSVNLAPGKDELPEEVTVDIYKAGQKLQSQTVKVENIKKPDTVNSSATISGTASIIANKKTVQIKGKINVLTAEKNDKWKLYAVGPDGKKHEVDVKKDNSFELSFNYQNRSFSSKAVHLELYSGNVLIASTDIEHGVPVNQSPSKIDPKDKAWEWDKKAKEDDKDKDKDKNKNKDKKHESKGKHNDRDED